MNHLHFLNQRGVFILVLILENAPPMLRGRLALWMFELKSGVYVCDANHKLREWIWDCVIKNIAEGSAIMVWSTTRSEFGFDIDACGVPKRILGEIDGIKFIKKVI